MSITEVNGWVSPPYELPPQPTFNPNLPNEPLPSPYPHTSGYAHTFIPIQEKQMNDKDKIAVGTALGIVDAMLIAGVDYGPSTPELLLKIKELLEGVGK